MENKKIILLFALILFIFIIISGCTDSTSEIGVLDMNRILEESRRAQELREDLTEIGARLEQEYNEIEAELEDDNKEVELDNIYRQFLTNKESLENQLNSEINQILSQIGEEMNLEVIVLKDFTKYGGRDITDEAISELDKEFSQNGGE